VHGTCAEPYSHAFPDVSLLRRYGQGFTLAEAFYLSLPFLYWQNVVVGDPLCAPCAARPRVSLRAPSGVWTGRVEVEVTAVPGSPRVGIGAVSLFVDGHSAGEQPGDRARFSLDTGGLRDGPHHILAVARGLDLPASTGWAATTVRVANPDLSVVDADPLPPRCLALEGGISLGFSRPLTVPGDGDAVRMEDAGGRRVPGTCELSDDGRRAFFRPRRHLRPCSRYRVKVVAAGRSGPRPVWSATLPTTAADLVLASDRTSVTAGDVLLLTLTAREEDGSSTYRGFADRIDLGTDDSLALLAPCAVMDAGAGELRIPVTLCTAGLRRIEARAASGPTASLVLRVRPGAFHGLVWEPGPVQVAGRLFEAPLRAADRFGNTVPGFTGCFAVRVRQGGEKRTLGELVFGPKDGGVKILRGIRLEKKGPAVLEALDAKGRVAGKMTVFVD
jgi:hypothetical protein